MGHTRDWINYYCGMRGGAPRRFWVPYIEELGSRSNYNCWYCERRCKIAIKDDGKEEILVKGDWSANTDHFRPRSLFPHLSLSWSNWVFSCETCNHFKDDRWPNKNVFPCEPDQNNEQIELEYVNPCASDPEESPAKYFNFYGGRIEPRQGISKANERKACNTINAFAWITLLWLYFDIGQHLASPGSSTPDSALLMLMNKKTLVANFWEIQLNAE